ncbi:uncharacterized protein BROUX77_003223 [Berkeleyomyces rouxiae]|uniref:uncharacterized protein n=1 Tax=Berkeleyomyces rouxiae TaxID=2035830 RepID=UPI003B7F0031
MPVSISSLAAATFVASQVALALPPTSPSRLPHTSRTTDPLPDSMPESSLSWPVKQSDSTDPITDGPAILAEIYQKYDIAMPRDLEATLSQLQKRKAFYSDVIYTSRKYTIPVEIGSEKTSYNLVLDTTSSGIVVLSDKAANPDVQGSYNPGTSTTSQKMDGYTWAIKNTFGDVYQDRVYVGTSEDGMSYDAQAIQVAAHSPEFENVQGISGVMGMALTPRNVIKPHRQPSFFDNIEDNLDQSIFTVDLKDCGDGDVDFGFIDDAAYIGQIGYSDVTTDRGLWNFTVEGLVTDAVTLAPEGSEYAIVDLATTIITLPWKYVVAYYNRVPYVRWSTSNNGFIVLCNQEMPDFTFRVGGIDLAVSGEHMKIYPNHGQQESCFGGLQASDRIGFNLIGNIAFKSTFVVFDPVNAEIGWAMKGNSEEPPQA